MSTAGDVLIGVDVGSTTVKCVVVAADGLELLWKRYRRHETRQAEKVAEMLAEIEAEFPQIVAGQTRCFITGSGAGPLVKPLGARFVQEVNAVTLAVERLHPQVDSVIELGGQDAKMILFQTNPNNGERRLFTSMNDKCASGTGATLDKCVLKVGMSSEALAGLSFDGEKLHPVAAKCGVFAETDIVNLIKSGVPATEVMNSLANAIVMQNLSVLSRGNTLRSRVLLLGGPNTYLPFLQQCWRQRIPETWQERGYQPDEVLDPEALILVPDNAQYYAAYGAVVFGLQEGVAGGYAGCESLQAFIAQDRGLQLAGVADAPLLAAGEKLADFARHYSLPPFQPAKLAGQRIRGYIGLDGGSTSSKAVLLDEQGEVLCKQYQLSKGNPIQDAKEILARIRDYVEDQDGELEVMGFGATGYAADVLEKVIRCDANIVETVAHMQSAVKYCGEDIDVICDIGGQDIKVLFMQHGTIKSFRLSNQCSAGNGMLLQAMADQFGVAIEDYAEVAFQAQLAPRFSYGCAVFLDSDRVNYQREGYGREALFAGLAKVLPKNVWQYVVQIPRLAELGRRFVLQGGTQYNLAAVKAQVDYIRERVPGAEVLIHPHCGEAGAIGAALEARRVVERQGYSNFIGLQAAIELHYSSQTDEVTRCGFCANHCARTFIDTETPDGERSRYIAGFSCDKGTVESKQEVVALNQAQKQLKQRYPNLVEDEASLLFRSTVRPQPLPEDDVSVDEVQLSRRWFGYGPVTSRPVQRLFLRSSEQAQQRRAGRRIGIPRALNLYMVAPFLRAYLEAVGVESRNIIFSDPSSEEMWREGGQYGSIDPCYPSKVSLAHVYQLLRHKHRRKPLDYVWFPCITHLDTFVSHAAASAACPVVAGTPKVVVAALTKEKDLFAEAGIEYLDSPINFELPELLRQQLYELWGQRLELSLDESDWACDQGWAAMRQLDQQLQHRGRAMLDWAEREGRLVILLLGRPYHSDPGLNHGIPGEFQALGYPVLSLRAIPKDPDYLRPLYAEDLAAGRIDDVFDVRDVWPENYSTNSVQKVWAAKFAARHPHVAVLDLSSFKCGHDAPTYGLIDKILATSRTPFMTLHDIDANKPGGSIKIRVKTFAYALARYQETMQPVHREAVSRSAEALADD